METKVQDNKSGVVNKEKRDKYVMDYLPLVKYVVGKFMIYLPAHLDQEDLIESGILGLIEAAERFKEDKGVQFKTYAFHRIRGSVLDYLRLQDWVPRSVREKDNLIKETHNTLEQKLGRYPQPEEVAEELGISCSELDKMLADINMCSMSYIEDINIDNDGDSRVSANEIIKDNKASEPLSDLESMEEKEVLERAIMELHPKEKLVITLYYYEDMLLREIAEVMNLSESRVSQLHHRALMSIRAKADKQTQSPKQTA
ncbi:MAG: RNA polymerase sigma factor FliA [Candidatus Scalindua arabica]|uniref:RNA polymerase sigma factor FliA n=1 Tax=Candidatus Scalindua arabica TaxID=1127984 RepID=A0A942A0T6_9BACT|nr:RNA polymerase sigma factor FliA [Candidatus Scalindua arabica]